MFKKILEAIIAIIPFLKELFSKENKKKRSQKKIRKNYEKKKKHIDNAIAGKEDISIVTDSILGDDGLDVQPEESNH